MYRPPSYQIRNHSSSDQNMRAAHHVCAISAKKIDRYSDSYIVNCWTHWHVKMVNIQTCRVCNIWTLLSRMLCGDCKHMCSCPQNRGHLHTIFTCVSIRIDNVFYFLGNLWSLSLRDWVLLYCSSTKITQRRRNGQRVLLITQQKVDLCHHRIGHPRCWR